MLRDASATITTVAKNTRDASRYGFRCEGCAHEVRREVDIIIYVSSAISRHVTPQAFQDRPPQCYAFDTRSLAQMASAHTTSMNTAGIPPRCGYGAMSLTGLYCRHQAPHDGSRRTLADAKPGAKTRNVSRSAARAWGF